MLLALTAALAALAPADDVASALAGCAATTTEAATNCMVDRLGKDRLLSIRTDRGHDVATYRAVGLAFALDRATTPVAANMASKGLYNADFAPMILIVLAKHKAGGAPVSMDGLRGLVTMVNQDQAKQRKEWPPADLGAKIELSRCPDVPQRRASGAVCVEMPAGGFAIVTPDAAKPGWLVDTHSLKPSAEAPTTQKAD